MDAHINALNRPKPPGRKGSSERGSLPDYRELLFNLVKTENSRIRKGGGIGHSLVP